MERDERSESENERMRERGDCFKKEKIEILTLDFFVFFFALAVIFFEPALAFFKNFKPALKFSTPRNGIIARAGTKLRVDLDGLLRSLAAGRRRRCVVLS